MDSYYYKHSVSDIAKISGFSIIELLVSLAIFSILVGLATPSFITMIQDNRLTLQVNEFMSSLHLARSEAIKRGVRITLCKSNNGADCTHSGYWSQGWITFIESDTENATREAGEPILRIHESLAGGNILQDSNNDIDDYISYVANGFSRTTGGAVQIGILTLCDTRKDNDKARAIRINATGTPQLSSVTEVGESC